MLGEAIPEENRLTDPIESKNEMEDLMALFIKCWSEVINLEKEEDRNGIRKMLQEYRKAKIK